MAIWKRLLEHDEEAPNGISSTCPASWNGRWTRCRNEPIRICLVDAVAQEADGPQGEERQDGPRGEAPGLGCRAGQEQAGPAVVVVLPAIPGKDNADAAHSVALVALAFPCGHRLSPRNGAAV